MEKVIRNGKVAVLSSPGFGVGWYTWNTEHKELIFHPCIVAMVEADRRSEITKEWVLEKLGIEIYTGGARDLTINWIPEGTAFHIEEYDGSENVVTSDDFFIV